MRRIIGVLLFVLRLLTHALHGRLRFRGGVANRLLIGFVLFQRLRRVAAPPVILRALPLGIAVDELVALAIEGIHPQARALVARHVGVVVNVWLWHHADDFAGLRNFQR